MDIILDLIYEVKILSVELFSSNWFVNKTSFNKPVRIRNRFENETCSIESRSASPILK